MVTALAATGMTAEALATAMSTATTVFEWVVTEIAGNALLMVMFALGIIPSGIRVFKKLKKAVR